MKFQAILLSSIGLAAMMPLAGSCIFHEANDITFINPKCGTSWCTRAEGTKGINSQGTSIDVTDDGLFIKGCKCLSESDNNEMEDGVALECGSHAGLLSCNLDADCEWIADALSSGIGVCLPTDADYQVQWEDIVLKTEADCEEFADDNNIDLAPDCAPHMTDKACGDHGCHWDGSACSWAGPNCLEAAVVESATLDGMFGDGDCALPNNACLGEVTGGGDDDDDGDGDDGDGDGGADTTGAPAHPWGDDFDTQISCDVGTCTVDQQLVDDIIANPGAGMGDSAEFDFVSTGLEVTGIDTQETTGQLLAELGLQNNDIVREIDGLSPTSMEGLLEIVDQVIDKTSVVVKIKRGASTITTSYEIDG